VPLPLTRELSAREEKLGKRQDNLKWLLANAGYRVGVTERPSLKWRTIEASLREEVQRVYQLLGGALDEFPTNLGHWDIPVGGVAIELDEERHFNRYRLSTLTSSVYSKLPKFPLSEYRSNCAQREAQCLAAAKYGGNWSNPSCIRQFGPQSSLGDLAPPGSPRWKQRAFYDFLKDLSPLDLGISLARVSIWDDVPVNGANVLVNQILLSRSLDAMPGLVRLIEERAGVKLSPNPGRDGATQTSLSR
jgi:hypothetical protein